jgi:hypothetical protein
VSATTRKSSWLKQNYEKLLLVVVLLLLLGSAVVLVLQVQMKSEEQAVVPPPVQFAKAKLLDASELAKKLEVLNRTNLMDVARGVMGDEVRVTCIDPKCNKPIPFDATNCPFCSTNQPAVINPLQQSTAGDGIPDFWKKKYGLDIESPAVAGTDPDGDGFSTLEEFRSGSNPMDPKSHPDFASTLRIWDLKAKPFKLRFMSAMKLGTTETFQINVAGSTRSLMVKIGEETVEGFKVVAHDPTAADGDVLVLDNGKEKLRLPKNKDLQGRMEYSAELVLLLDRTRYKNLSKGDNFKIRDTTYNVIDITTNAVTIRRPQSGGDVVVPRITDAEKNDVLNELAVETAEAPPPTAPGAMQQSPAVRSEGLPVPRVERVPVRPRGEVPVRPRGEEPVPVRPRGRG